MDVTTWVIIGIVSMLVSALFSGCEMAYVTSDRVRVEIDVKQGGVIAGIINRFYANSEFFISSILVGNNIVLVIYGMAAAALLEPVIEQWTANEAFILIAQTLISTGIILLAGEFIPKTIFGINPNRSLKVFALPIYIFYIALYPLSLFSTWLSRCLMKLLGVKASSTRLRAISIGDLNDYLEETIDTMEEKKTRVENEVKIFHNALDFSSTHLRDCMIPRNELIAVNIEELHARVSPHSSPAPDAQRSSSIATTSTPYSAISMSASCSILSRSGAITSCRCFMHPKIFWQTR